MNLTLRSTLAYRFAELADFLNRSFAGYLVDVRISPASLAQLVRCEGTDLTASRLIVRDDAVIGCALIGRRGWTSRLAAMGLMPEGRNQGIGRWTMDQLITEAKQRGERTMVLEVMEQNTPAVRLYRSVGFQIQRRLVGYTAIDPIGVPDERLQEVDLREVAWAVNSYGLPDLPWQLAGATLVETGPPQRGYRLGPAYAAISDPAQRHVALRGLIIHPDHQRQGWGTRLLQALAAEHPDRIWKLPIIYPEELVSDFMENLGFEPEDLSQFQMSLDLTAS